MPGTIRLGPLGEAPVSAVRASAYSPRANPNRARSGRVGERCTCPLAQLQDLQERREAAHARRGGARHSSECRCSAWSCAGNAQTCCASRCIALFVRVQQQHGVELLLCHHIPHLLKSLGAQLHCAVVGPDTVVRRHAIVGNAARRHVHQIDVQMGGDFGCGIFEVLVCASGR
jgi:hypothetical protein